jgi:membrane protein YdbS with pleckstrin-like domain
MKFKTSIVSQLFEIALILLIALVLFILISVYNVNLLKISFASIFWYILLIIGFVILDEILVRKLYTYEIDEAGIKETFMLFSKKETLIPYSNVTKVDLRKPFVGRLLNYGDIEVVGAGATKIVIKGIRNPERVYQEISKRLEKLGKVKEESE